MSGVLKASKESREQISEKKGYGGLLRGNTADARRLCGGREEDRWRPERMKEWHTFRKCWVK